MIKTPSVLVALPMVLAFGVCYAAAQAPVPQATAEPTVAASGTPTAAEEQKAEQMVQNSSNDRHLAPHDTFYILSYVAVKTGTGVEGFDPGQEVHLVEVNRDNHTLIVSDGHAQVEVQPSQLTNDIDMATAARQKDQASQARVAAYAQRTREAYDKFQKEAADATQKDLDRHNKEVKEIAQERAKEESAPVASTAPAANVPLSGPGYYGNGGYGYGDPYSYFINTNSSTAAAPAKAPSAPAAAPGAVAAPTGGGHAGGGGRAK